MSNEFLFIQDAVNFKFVLENIDKCLRNPCENGGTCFDDSKDYICFCANGYTGNHCEGKFFVKAVKCYRNFKINSI